MASLIPAVCPLGGQPVLDLNSAILRGAQVFAYNAETTTSRTVFQDYACTIAHPSPIKTNAYGRIPAIYVDIGDYKIVIRDAAGSLVGSYEHFPGGQQSASSSATPSGFTTGDLKPAYSNIPQNGWLVANGGTIGNGNSAASSRANDDTFNLFVALWNTNPNLVVTPSRGTSATLDFQGSKTLALPDMRGLGVVGVDKMGAAQNAGRITSISTATPDQVGATFGTDSTTLGVSQLPVFTPSITMGVAGAHAHFATADVQGYHSHGGYTNASGDHAHSYVHSNIGNAGGFNAGSGGNQGGYVDNTGNAGNHSHTVVTDGQGSHSHNITVSAVPDHVHALAAQPIGGGAAHPNMPPTVLVYWHIRL